MKTVGYLGCAAIGAVIGVFGAEALRTPAHAQGTPEGTWTISSVVEGSGTEAWVMNTRTRELFFCWSDAGGRNCQWMPTNPVPFVPPPFSHNH